jgi:hypothetical protein
LCLALQRRDFVRVDPHHQIVDVILDPGEPVTGAGGNDDDVAGLDLAGDAVANIGPVISRTVEFDDVRMVAGPSLPVDDPCRHGLSALPSAPFTARIRMNEDSVTAP